MNTILNSSYTENELVERIAAGEKALFEIIIRRLNPSLYKLARSFGFNHQDAEDLMQEAYINGYLQLKQFEGRSSLKTWFTRILVNKCIYKKKHGYYSKESFAFDHTNDETNSMQSPVKDTTTAEILRREFSNVLESALSEMPEIYRTVFVCREIENFNVAETAEILDISEVNVKVRLNRAKAVLQEKIEKYYTVSDVYDFNLVYCDGIVNKVMAEIQKL